jgi:hypothetical protein
LRLRASLSVFNKWAAHNVKNIYCLIPDLIYYSLPKRKIKNINEFYQSFPGITDVFIDGTERGVQRPSNSKNNKKRYSGKQKKHTRKNTIVSDENKRILFISPTKDGRCHDLTQLKKTQLLEHIPKQVTIWVDKGYQGIKKIIKNANIVAIPHKKSKKSPLTYKQKEDNKIMSGFRIIIEHAINGIKRFACLVNTCRCRRGQDDKWMMACSALWNFHIQYKSC